MTKAQKGDAPLHKNELGELNRKKNLHNIYWAHSTEFAARGLCGGGKWNGEKLFPDGHHRQRRSSSGCLFGRLCNDWWSEILAQNYVSVGSSKREPELDHLFCAWRKGTKKHTRSSGWNKKEFLFQTRCIILPLTGISITFVSRRTDLKMFKKIFQ